MQCLGCNIMTTARHVFTEEPLKQGPYISKPFLEHVFFVRFDVPGIISKGVAVKCAQISL